MRSEKHSDVSESMTPNESGASKQGASTNQPNVDPNLSCENKPEEIIRNLQDVSYIYKRDVVKSKINGNIGMVNEVAGDSDSDSSIGDEEDDDAGPSDEGDVESKRDSNKNADADTDDDYKHSPLTSDQVRVIWMDDSETIESTYDVTVVDRAFLHGDYVAAASDPTGQIGIVVDVNITVDLLTHNGIVLKDRPSRELKRVKDFTVDDHVVLGPWLGRIEDVFDNVTVLLDDGSVCKVMKADPLHLKPIGKDILEDEHFSYYPGQRVKASSSSVFKNSRWLSGLWKANQLEGTVTKVTVGSVFIYWIASAGYGTDSANTPAEEQSPKNLKLLSCFAHTNWQLGDWCLFPSTSDSSAMPLDMGKLNSESHNSAKDKDGPENTETGYESDSVLTSIEDSTGRDKSIEDGPEDSLSKKCETSKNGAPAESSLCSSSVSDSKGAMHESWPLHRKTFRLLVRKDKKARKKVENFERALLIINTKTKVDVVWQDGMIEQGLDSASLIPIDSPGDHEFVAEQYVVEKSADDRNDGLEIRRVGVVKSVNAKDRTACVRWLKPIEGADEPKEFDREEVVSVYELEGHPDYDYCYGDVVVRLLPVSLHAKIDRIAHFLEDTAHDSPDEPKHDQGKHHGSRTADSSSVHSMSSEFSDFSWVGNITGLKDGDVEVTWADGMISTVGPQAIYVVDRGDDDESIAAGSDGSDDDAASWETVEDDNIETIDNGKEDKGTDNATDIRPEIEGGNLLAENSGNNGALSITLSALGFMTRLASGIFSGGKKHYDDPLDLNSKNEDDLDPDELTLNRDPANESSSQKPNDNENRPSQLSNNCKGDEHDVSVTTDVLDSVGTPYNSKPPQSEASSCDEFVSTFKGFDIVSDPCDHYFLGSQGQNSASRKWLKKVQRDWDILQNNLPEGIYVRAYEDRMDLLRAVIVGAYGTPYQDGLFFFDFHLPPEYPDVPPLAHYHSGGWRINPNLYEEGKVCLSLLNTWTGRGNEVWDPQTSSILQILVSIQGLVLNSKPYFNEAGYDKQVGTAEGEKKSLSYNENSFLLNCKTVMYLMRKPPKDFQELVSEHFRKRGYYILKACDAYMKGHLIGSLKNDASVSNNTSADSNSVGFKIMLSKILPKLFSALHEVGADCQEFKHLIQPQQ